VTKACLVQSDKQKKGSKLLLMPGAPTSQQVAQNQNLGG
ncbi:unnamed protein product, partial [marine sediment metagenome]